MWKKIQNVFRRRKQESQSVIQEGGSEGTSEAPGYEDRYIFEFKRDYYRHGKHDMDVQVHHLGRLADYYTNRYNNLKPQHWTDCLKAHALCNSAAARKPLSEWPQRAFEIQQTYWGEWSDITYVQQSQITQRLLERLYGIRDDMRSSLASADKRADNFSIHQTYPADMMSDFSVCMQEITVGCTDEMVRFSGLLIDESVKFLNRAPPCDFSVIGLGSLARGETTPYSDLEYLFLVDSKSPEIEEYFERLAVTSYFLIGNLAETNLKYMHIAELNGWFEDRCKSGFKIDGLSPGAGNIPTGNGQCEQRNHLIVTPEELSSRYREVLNNPEVEKALRGDLTSMLTYMKTIYVHGDDGHKLIDLVRTNIHKSINSDKRIKVNMDMLENDVTKFNFTPDKKLRTKGFTVDVKREIYRFPSILLLDISIVSGCVSDSSWATCDKLVSDGHITIEFHRSLKFMLACACYMRLSAYLHLDSDSFNDGISIAPMFSPNMGQHGPNQHHRKWFMPVGLYTVLCQILMRVREGVTTVLRSGKQVWTENLDLSKEKNSWISKLHALYSAGRFMDCLHILQTEIRGEGSLVEFASGLSNNYHATDQNKLLEVIADVYDHCSKPRSALEISLYTNSISDSDINVLALAESYITLCEYDKALEIVSSIKEKTADCTFLLGRIYSKQGHLQKAERTLVEALQLYSNEASQPPLYDYYGSLVPNDETIAGEFPDLLNCNPENRLTIIQSASSDIIKCVRELGTIYWKMDRFNLTKAYDKKTLDLTKVVYGDEALVGSLATLYNSIAISYDDNNHYEQSERHYLTALEVCENLYGADADHTDTAKVLSNLGNLYHNKSDYTKAEDYERRALTMYRNVYGETSTHDDIIRVINILASNYKSQKLYDEARGVNDQILVMLREKHGADTDHSDIAESLRRIGTFHTDIEQYSTADDYLHQALDMYQRIHGQDNNHKDIALVLYNIGYNDDENSDYSRAVEFFKRALVMYKEVYGTDSSRTDIANCLNNIGVSHEKMRHFDEAGEYYQQALTMYREIYGEASNHADIANCLYNIGVSHEKMKHYDEAGEYYQQALTMYREIYGEESNHADIADSLYVIGNAYKELKQVEKAEEYYQQALSMYTNVYGADSKQSHVAQTLEALGIVYNRMENYSKSLYFYHKSLNMYREIYKADINHTKLASLLHNLGKTYKGMEEYSTAEDYYTQSLEMYRAIYGVDSNHVDIAKSLCRLGGVNFFMGHYSKCLEFYDQSLNMYRDVYKTDMNQIEVAHLFYNLANAHFGEKAYSTAEGYYTQSLEMYRVIYGADSNHVDIADCLRKLTACYYLLENHEQAVDSSIQALIMYRAVQPDHENIDVILEYLKERGIAD